jgi:hypothetical protein
MTAEPAVARQGEAVVLEAMMLLGAVAWVAGFSLVLGTVEFPVSVLGAFCWHSPEKNWANLLTVENRDPELMTAVEPYRNHWNPGSPYVVLTEVLEGELES